MKYLIAKNPHGIASVFMCAAPETHQSLSEALAAKGYTTISAGFVLLNSGYTATTFGRSSSLNLEPRDQDAQLIGLFYKMTVEQGLDSEK